MRQEIADEMLIVRDSGEIPEVALHGSIHYLCHDPEGPGMVLGDEELAALRRMAAERYQEIILRDLDPRNRCLPLYRGPARCLVNWKRYCIFCEREEMEVDGSFRKRAARALARFIACELEELEKGPTAVNCSADELAELAACLGLDPQELPRGWERLCLAGDRKQNP